MQVKRDCFARGGYERFTETHGTCAWCGTKKKRLYKYVWENDGLLQRAKESHTDKVFCDMGCFESYYFQTQTHNERRNHN